MTADEIKALLHLEPHPVEGGWYRRTYTSNVSVALLRGVRPYGTAIYYLLEEGTFSEMHVLVSDEIFHFYLRRSSGDAATAIPMAAPLFLLLDQISRLVSTCNSSCRPAYGRARASSMMAKLSGKVALLGCTVTPGFDFADYRSSSYAELLRWLAGEAGAHQKTHAELSQRRSRKKFSQQLRRFLRANSLLHLHLVVELRVVEHREHRAAGAGLGIGGGKHQPVEARVNHGSGAHGAGLQRHVKRAARAAGNCRAPLRPRAGPRSPHAPWDRRRASTRFCPRAMITP